MTKQEHEIIRLDLLKQIEECKAAKTTAKKFIDKWEAQHRLSIVQDQYYHHQINFHDLVNGD